MTDCAKIFAYESMATADGDGIRYCVFMSGCPLRCVYCHNPDSWSQGDLVSADDLIKKILRYKPYFAHGGGVTFSGGEPLLQADFIASIGSRLRENGIGYFLDTSGAVTLSKNVKLAIDNADCVMLDLKFCDFLSYKRYTKGDMSLCNKVGDYISSTNKRLWLRTVIMPGINDTIEDIKIYAQTAMRWNVEKYDLLPFHTMGFAKYTNLNIENPLIDMSDMPYEKIALLQQQLNNLLKN